MSEDDLPPRPPLVRYKSKVAWLRARRRTENAWWALIYWHNVAGDGGIHVIELLVSFDDVERIQGEDYAGVPTLTA